jgi:predicted transcriptional regulator
MKEETMHASMLDPRAPAAGLAGVRVQDLMTAGPLSVRHNATIREAAVFLDRREVGGAPVVNEAGRAIGVLSRFDVLLAVNAGLEGAPVREVMTPSVIAVRPHTPALDALDHMVRHMVRRVFVVDDEGVSIGVVSMTDLGRGLATVWSAPVGHPELCSTEELTS